jgi:hypothetical protein
MEKRVAEPTVPLRILKEKAFPYAKYRDTFVRLGRIAGFEESLELYQLRRASGRNINSKSAVDSVLPLFRPSL